MNVNLKNTADKEMTAQVSCYPYVYIHIQVRNAIPRLNVVRIVCFWYFLL